MPMLTSTTEEIDRIVTRAGRGHRRGGGRRRSARGRPGMRRPVSSVVARDGRSSLGVRVASGCIGLRRVGGRRRRRPRRCRRRRSRSPGTSPTPTADGTTAHARRVRPRGGGPEPARGGADPRRRVGHRQRPRPDHRGQAHRPPGLGGVQHQLPPGRPDLAPRGPTSSPTCSAPCAGSAANAADVRRRPARSWRSWASRPGVTWPPWSARSARPSTAPAQPIVDPNPPVKVDRGRRLVAADRAWPVWCRADGGDPPDCTDNKQCTQFWRLPLVDELPRLPARGVPRHVRRRPRRPTRVTADGRADLVRQRAPTRSPGCPRPRPTTTALTTAGRRPPLRGACRARQHADEYRSKVWNDDDAVAGRPSSEWRRTAAGQLQRHATSCSARSWSISVVVGLAIAHHPAGGGAARRRGRAM